MDDFTKRSEIEAADSQVAGADQPSGLGRKLLFVGIAVVALGAVWGGFRYFQRPQTATPAAPLAHVTVSKPLQRDVDRRLGFLGQFSAIDRVELRAQVGGTLTEIHFRDGQIVHKGDLLFVIDPRPYEIKLAEARAQLQAANARVALANTQLSRAQSLRRNEFASQETVDQRTNDTDSALAAVEDAKARIKDAELDLEYCRVTAPFTGRIGARQVSLGSLIAGSRAAVSPTTLLATLVSLDPIYLDFDMSESDYLAFTRAREHASANLANRVVVGLSDENKLGREGTLDFVDNALDRSSGTIHARATLQNSDLFLAPGQFARLQLAVSPPASVLMIPDAAVILDQSQHIVMTVAPDGTVTPKIVEIGDLRGGLRIVRSGLNTNDNVVVGGFGRAIPGTKVAPDEGSITFDHAVDG
ncbi:MAG: efflux RND transporter periplasmic adaptor subunit [Xanthobacteraceae bacterium]|nr:efflux RND transporter periplasmic adaptor subunit [Xanthobacteraceae bacterium]